MEGKEKTAAEIIFGGGAHQWALTRAYQAGRDEERERCALLCEAMAREQDVLAQRAKGRGRRHAAEDRHDEAEILRAAADAIKSGAVHPRQG